MSFQIIPQRGSLSSQIGAGLGQGLSEQIPKELERGRLASGLRQFEQESANLTPMQALARLTAIPGITPQAIQSFGELAKQQARGNALKTVQPNEPAQQQKSPFTKIQVNKTRPQGQEAPSLTTRKPIEATLKPHIPKSYDEILQSAGQRYEENPALYNNDPQLAINAAVQEDAQNQAINTAQQVQRSNEQNVQNKIIEDLKGQRSQLGAQVPGNVYDAIEDKAINAVKSKEDGGEGLTEQEAKKKYGKELDAISRQYEAIETIGNWTLAARKPSETMREIKSIRHDFEKRNDLENFADSLISKNDLSPSKAYYLSYPSSSEKDLNNELIKIPKLKSEFKGGLRYQKPVKKNIESETLKYAEKLAPLLGKNGSPLSVAEELYAKGYDPEIWLKYLDKNRDNLTERQGRELGKPRNFIPTLNDMWLFYNLGLEPLQEVE